MVVAVSSSVAAAGYLILEFCSAGRDRWVRLLSVTDVLAFAVS
jgi:hypothetical protein